jgi:hypothetical protein
MTVDDRAAFDGVSLETLAAAAQYEGTISDRKRFAEALALELMGLQRPEMLDVRIDAGEVPPVATDQLDVMARAGVQVIGIGDATTAREVLEPQDLPARLGLTLAPHMAEGQVDVKVPARAPALERSEEQKRIDHVKKAINKLEEDNDPRLADLLARTRGFILPWSASAPHRLLYDVNEGHELLVKVGISDTSADAKTLRKLVQEKVKEFIPAVTVKLSPHPYLRGLAAAKEPAIAERLLKEGIKLHGVLPVHAVADEPEVKYAQGTSPKWRIKTDRPVSAALLRDLSMMLRNDPSESPRPIQNAVYNGARPPDSYTPGDVIV